MAIKNSKVLVTGGATGIGLALAKRFAQDGNTVIVCGRRLEALRDAQKEIPGLLIRQCDLSLKEQRTELFEWIKEEHNDLNALVNNAGIQNWMHIEDREFYSKAANEIAINIEAPVHLCQLFIHLPQLHTIVNVTSGLAFIPLVKAPVYSATKAFFHSFTLSLRQLLKERNIKVVEIIPPALNTDLGGKGIHDFAPPVADFIKTIFEKWEQGEDTLTDQMSATLANAGPEQMQHIFQRMNG